jgi:N,N-dimethylformamidase
VRSLFGYSDQISARAGDSISFLVSSLKGLRYRADIARLICGDDSPGGPSFKETPVPTGVDGEYPGRAQPIHDGSYVIVPSTQALASLRSFTLQKMVWPTTPGRGRQALLGTWCEQTGTGFGLYIDEAGALAVCVGAGSGTFECLSTGTPLVGRQWYAAAASFDADSGELRVFQRPLNVGPGVGDAVSARKTVSIELVHREPVPLLMEAQAEAPGAALVGAHFNGKLDRPRVARRALSQTEIEKLESPTVPDDLAEDIVGCWDFSHELSGVRVVDLSVGALHGATVNMATRGVRGHNWTGSEHCWRHAPEQYGAIHFHDDDLYDAGWQTDFALTTPESMRSGIYCARLIGAEDEERIPFFVRPARRQEDIGRCALSLDRNLHGLRQHAVCDELHLCRAKRGRHHGARTRRRFSAGESGLRLVAL